MYRRGGTKSRTEALQQAFSALAGALEIKAAAGLSYWDAAIVAAARALGCGEILSEDMSHGRMFGGIMITNPFR
jgi:predicted nucleic acid-binding protein